MHTLEYISAILFISSSLNCVFPRDTRREGFLRMEDKLVSGGGRIVIDNQLESDSRDSDTCASEMRTDAVSKR